VPSEANSSQATTAREACQIFSDFADKYKRDYGKLPVLIINDADYLTESNSNILEVLQDYAKLVTDTDIAEVVFVSGKGILQSMQSKFI
jgi:hypothetical protein